MISIEEMATFCKRKGFVFHSSEIYGGLSGFFDYGPLGVELKNNIKNEWWKFHVNNRQDIVGIDGSIISNSKIWEASGHVENFSDVMLECTKCKELLRADHLIEDTLKIQAEGLSLKDINKLIKQNKIKCTKCKSELSEASKFNLMFQTNVGPKESKDSLAYLRPETAQLIFSNFKLVNEVSRLKLPFGIAQTGKAFRNEISPRNFLFRCREFEQMEIEYFIDPKNYDKCPFIKEVENHSLIIYSSDMQIKKQKAEKLKIKDALSKKIIKSPWHAYWLALSHKWFISLGANPDNFRIRQHLPDEKSHYSKDCWDLEYNFPFGFKELQGIADRGDFDLQQHIKHSKKDLSIFDDNTKQRIIPHVVAEPSLGVDRAFLVFMYDAYEFDKKRDNIVLRLHPKLAVNKVAIFPLLSNKKELVKESEKIYNSLKENFTCFLDISGSIGRRYARQDEAGTFLCVTIDFDSLKDKDITIRDRDTMKQIRVKTKDLKETLNKLLNQEIKFEKAGKLIK